MKSIKRIFVALVFSTLVFFGANVSANAQVQTMPDGTQFDPQFYAATYPDVAAVYGTNPNSLYKHYVDYGRNEGRRAYADGSTNSSADVNTRLMALKATYPEGTLWGMGNAYKGNNSRPWSVPNPVACQAFAYLVQDTVFGSTTIKFLDTTSEFNRYYKNAEARSFDDIWNSLRPGDIIHDNNHSVVVLSKSENSITVVEGNYSINHGPGMVHWGRTISIDYLRGNLRYVETAY